MRWKRMVFIGMAAFITGCGGTSTSHSASPSPPRTHAVSATPSAVSNAVVQVIGAGAAPSSTGTMAFAVVEYVRSNNASPIAINITLTANSSNAFAPVSVTIKLPSVQPGETQAVATPLAIPPGDEIAKVNAVAAAGPQSSPFPIVMAQTPTFQPDPIQPSANVSVSSTTSTMATVIVVCWSRSSDLLGGGQDGAVSISAGEPKTVAMRLALLDTPDHCTAYGRANQ